MDGWMELFHSCLSDSRHEDRLGSGKRIYVKQSQRGLDITHFASIN